MKKIENLLHKIANRKTILLAVASLYFSAFSVQASSELTTIDTAYLNSLTGAKVTWEEVASAGEDTIAIGDKFYKYTYHMPDDYEPSTRLNNDLTAENTTNKVFMGEYIGSGAVKGVAIYNSKIFQNPIIADFIENYAQSTSYKVYGGAVYNNGSMGDITGSFIGNYAYSDNSGAYGGAIYNNHRIGDITGDFIGNYAYSQDYAYGGAIYNHSGTIGDITGDFIGNYAYGYSGDKFVNGGAIYNYSGTIGDITGDFSDNYAYSGNDSAEGGAIYNRTGTIDNIIGNFNHV